MILETAKEMKETGDELRVVFDGAGTEGLATLSDPQPRAHGLYAAVADQVSGACSYCANAFHMRDKLVQAEVPLLSYQVLMF